MCDVRILNGRCGADKGHGRFTCTTYNGNSVVDYVLCSSRYIDYTCDFCVCDQNEFSGHNPIDFNIKTAHLRISGQIPDTNVKMVWNPDSAENFVNALQNENVIDSLKYMMEMIENVSEDDASQCVNDANFVFTNDIRKAADLLFKREFSNWKTCVI